MKALVITCDSCRQSWKLGLQASLYLQLDLSSRPCPHCEAYTLSCPDTVLAPVGRRVHVPPLRRRSVALVQPAPG